MGNLELTFGAKRAMRATERARRAGTLFPASGAQAESVTTRASAGCVPIDALCACAGMRWYVVESEIGREMSIIPELIGRRVAAYLPTVWNKVTRGVRRVKVWEMSPMFVGYFFVRTAGDDASYHRVKHARGVADFLTVDGQLMTATDKEMRTVLYVEQQLALERLGREVVRRLDLKEGDHLTLQIDHPLAHQMLTAHSHEGRMAAFFGNLRVRLPKNPHVLEVVPPDAA